MHEIPDGVTLTLWVLMTYPKTVIASLVVVIAGVMGGVWSFIRRHK